MAFAKGKYGPQDWNQDLEKTKEKLNPFTDENNHSRNIGNFAPSLAPSNSMVSINRSLRPSGSLLSLKSVTSGFIGDDSVL